MQHQRQSMWALRGPDLDLTDGPINLSAMDYGKDLSWALKKCPACPPLSSPRCFTSHSSRGVHLFCRCSCPIPRVHLLSKDVLG